MRITEITLLIIRQGFHPLSIRHEKISLMSILLYYKIIKQISLLDYSIQFSILFI